MNVKTIMKATVVATIEKAIILCTRLILFKHVTHIKTVTKLYQTVDSTKVQDPQGSV